MEVYQAMSISYSSFNPYYSTTNSKSFNKLSKNFEEQLAIKVSQAKLDCFDTVPKSTEQMSLFKKEDGDPNLEFCLPRPRLLKSEFDQQTADFGPLPSNGWKSFRKTIFAVRGLTRSPTLHQSEGSVCPSRSRCRAPSSVHPFDFIREQRFSHLSFREIRVSVPIWGNRKEVPRERNGIGGIVRWIWPVQIPQAQAAASAERHPGRRHVGRRRRRHRSLPHPAI